MHEEQFRSARASGGAPDTALWRVNQDEIPDGGGEDQYCLARRPERFARDPTSPGSAVNRCLSSGCLRGFSPANR